MKESEVYIVTGSGSGIGQATAHALGRTGAKVACLDIDEDAASNTAADLKHGQALRCDVGRFDQCEHAVQTTLDTFGSVSGLVHCAAVFGWHPMDDLSPDDLSAVLQTNVVGTMQMAKLSASAIQKSGRSGSLVLFSSGASQRGLGAPAYAASKGAVEALTREMSVAYRRADGPLNLLVDSTGIKFLGDGEWQARKHGVQGRRQWRRVHLAMDTATSDIQAVAFTPSRDGDSPVLPDLLGQIPVDENISTGTADGAYDTRRCHTAILARDAVPIIPIRKHGRSWKEDAPAAIARNEALSATRYYGRAFWKRWTGYHARSRIEAKMRCLKSFGERIAARDLDRQISEIHFRIALMNRFNALGIAEIVRVA